MKILAWYSVRDKIFLHRANSLDWWSLKTGELRKWIQHSCLEYFIDLRVNNKKRLSFNLPFFGESTL